MVIDRTTDTINDLKLEHGVRRLQELAKENKRGHVFFWLEPGKEKSRVDNIEWAVRE